MLLKENDVRISDILSKFVLIHTGLAVNRGNEDNVTLPPSFQTNVEMLTNTFRATTTISIFCSIP